MNNKNKCTFFGFESYSLQKTEKPIKLILRYISKRE